ncbi:hypothetical protein LSAT2_024318, partial [Lamellibrachia satsuma]
AMVLGTMKRRGHTKHEPQNLKRFRATVEKFTQDQLTVGGKTSVSDDEDIHSGGSLTRPKSRKSRRKKERKEREKRKKIFSKSYHSKCHYAILVTVNLPTAESLQREKEERMKANQKRRKMKEKRKERRERKQERKRAETEEREAEEKAEVEAERDDDRMIRQMEKNLRLNKRKSKNLPQSFVNDGLDYILDAVDGKLLEREDAEFLPGPGYSDDEESEEEDASGSGDSESDNRESDPKKALPTPPLPDAGEMSGILKGKASDKAKKQKSVCFVEEQTGETSPQEVTVLKSLKKTPGEEEVFNETEALNSEDETEDVTIVPSKSMRYTEDIYGRLHDNQGNIVSDTLPSGGSYVPPGRRSQLTGSEDGKKKLELERMRKQLKGLINRLSESNLQPISSQIEALFRSYSRAELSETLTQIVFDACVSCSRIPERLITEHALLIAILHRNVGSEVGETPRAFL